MTTDSYNLDAVKREINGKKVSQLRSQGQVPAVLYGFGAENTQITVDQKIFRKIYRDAGSNGLVKLQLDGKTVPVLIQDVQVHPVTEAVLHVDFYAVNMKEEVETEVPLSFVGTAPAVKELAGNFVSNRHEVEVRALPAEIPSGIEVDISVLATFEDSIRAKDLKIPAGVELLTDPEETIAFVEEPMSDEELKAELEAPVDAKAEEEAAAAALGADKPAEGEESAEGEATEEEKKAE